MLHVRCLATPFKALWGPGTQNKSHGSHACREADNSWPQFGSLIPPTIERLWSDLPQEFAQSKSAASSWSWGSAFFVHICLIWRLWGEEIRSFHIFPAFKAKEKSKSCEQQEVVEQVEQVEQVPKMPSWTSWSYVLWVHRWHKASFNQYLTFLRESPSYKAWRFWCVASMVHWWTLCRWTGNFRYREPRWFLCRSAGEGAAWAEFSLVVDVVDILRVQCH